MKQTTITIFLLFIAAVFVVACAKSDTTGTTTANNQLGKDSANTQIANPASTNCIDKGGKLDIRTDANGGQYGVCILAGGKECEEWAFYKGDCK